MALLLCSRDFPLLHVSMRISCPGFVAPHCLAVSCGQPALLVGAADPALRRRFATITTDDIMLQHSACRPTDSSASDRDPGRRRTFPPTSEFERLGLTPGNPGSFIQTVDMVGFTGAPSASLSVGSKTIALRFPDDYVSVSRHEKPQINVVGSDLVFVGYGVVAPEYGWDDYKDVDVRGKTIVMLVNDPAIPTPNDSSQLDSAMFRGKAMTYYGRLTYSTRSRATKAPRLPSSCTRPNRRLRGRSSQWSWGREKSMSKHGASCVPECRSVCMNWTKPRLLSTQDFDFDSPNARALQGFSSRDAQREGDVSDRECRTANPFAQCDRQARRLRFHAQG